MQNKKSFKIRMFLIFLSEEKVRQKGERDTNEELKLNKRDNVRNKVRKRERERKLNLKN